MKVYPEITPVTKSDLFVLQYHENADFDYPIHSHEEYELSLIINSGGDRFIGDSIDAFGEVDLVLLGPGIQHCWEPAADKLENVTVTTLQFGQEIFQNKLFDKKEFSQFVALRTHADRGIAFHGESVAPIVKALNQLKGLSGFPAVIGFMKLLDRMANAMDFDLLLSEGYSNSLDESKSRRINIAYEYVMKNFDKKILIGDVAASCNMSESAFSHFFKKCTNKSFTQFLTDVRLGQSYRLLLETKKNVAEICYECGFNNLSNFNRIFKKEKGMTPLAFRKYYEEKTFFEMKEDFWEQSSAS
ncbi:AraC family transcriptional regulator [Persicobacter diffluens]|uniref:AraC family transcriptional regulator n=1 Tax=Persicobacter diffluens TaxID=981 RepID=A0AAN4VZR0_9BACT|nr:AraC family transcriptional regulator [Persicobacter diffluens]